MGTPHAGQRVATDSGKMRGQGDFVIVADPALPRGYSSEPAAKP
jgi:hypothetical protein